MQLSKSALHKQQAQLRSFERFLPSLDLKRRQLLQELRRERAALAAEERALEGLKDRVSERMPMLANPNVDLAGLARLDGVELGAENRLGTVLPTLQRVEATIRPYGLLTKPHWVDPLADDLKDAVTHVARMRVMRARLARIEAALKTVTQRVNLFEKVLIPRARAHIRKIEVHLSDAERAAVVRAKIAKAKRARQAEAAREEAA